MIMIYGEYIPVAPLQQIVKLIWVLEDVSGETRGYEKILPDGCAEMIFHCGDPMVQRENGKEATQDHHFVYGQLSKFIELRPAGKTAVIGVKYHPWGLSCLSDLPQFEINQQTIFPPDIFKNSDNYIHEKICATTDIMKKIGFIQQFLLDILRTRKKRFDNTSMQFAIKELYQSGGTSKIAGISHAMNISSRELERKFKKNIGLSPKQIARIYHFQSVFQLKNKTGSLTDLALTAGYYDQSHFIREFREIAGVNPSTFFKEKNDLTEIFIDNTYES